MEGSNSERPQNRANHRNVDNEDIIISFGSFQLHEDGSTRFQASNSPGNNGFNISSQPLRQNITNDRLSRNLVPDDHNIWSYHDFTTRGEKFVEDLLSGPENFAGGSNRQLSMNSLSGSSLTPNSVNRSSILNDYQHSRTITQNQGIEGNPFFSGYGHHLNYGQTNSGGLWNQNVGLYGRRNYLYGTGTTQLGSNSPREILEERNQVHESIFELMTDEHGHCVFEKLVEESNGRQLHSIILNASSNSQLFIDATFCKHGANSIQRLIKKVKKTPEAFMVTQILSTGFYELMTHHIARHVIQQCLNLLGNKPNEILYDLAIHYFRELATHEVGCISLNECINSISGFQRTTLLDHIANLAAYLSNDPYGNYVVQHVLTLRNESVTEKILHCLKGQFIHLAQIKGGSHVVEKCIQFSECGMRNVIGEILENRKAPSHLARDQFGNYVIQKALKMTKFRGATLLYKCLLMALQPDIFDLGCTKSGKHVVALLKEEANLGERSY
ncbi:putative pumilio8 [Abeliophyllum distichum]|uniref:Pumilio8 n=1 Tax=Abeliophyllum distichum TaxID=126358 RepID=A0ABD1UGI8_9LAMI